VTTDTTTRILIAEDDVHVASVVATALAREGYAVDHVADGGQLVTRILDGDYALVVLDWMLPGRSGLDCGREIRARSPIPILMLTARSDEADVVRAIEVCADDYVVKPFSVPELVVRVRALLRRRELDRADAAQAQRSVPAGGIVLDVRRREVSVDGRPVELTRTEFELLVALARHPGELLTRDELMRQLWRTDSTIESRACDFHVRNIRAKIETDPHEPARLITVRGEGYRLICPAVVLGEP
jgi:DNA-binding response OmpR family regulator